MLSTDRQTNQRYQKHNLLCQGGKNQYLDFRPSVQLIWKADKVGGHYEMVVRVVNMSFKTMLLSTFYRWPKITGKNADCWLQYGSRAKYLQHWPLLYIVEWVLLLSSNKITNGEMTRSAVLYNHLMCCILGNGIVTWLNNVSSALCYPTYRVIIDMIFTARQLQEKCQEQHRNLYTTLLTSPKPLTLWVEKACGR